MFNLVFPVNNLASGHRAAHQASDISSREDELGIDVEPRWFGLPSFYQQLGRVEFTRAVVCLIHKCLMHMRFFEGGWHNIDFREKLRQIEILQHQTELRSIWPCIDR